MQFELPLDAPKIYVFVGEPNSGKSYCIKSLMKDFAKAKHFKFGLAISPTSYNGDLDYLPSKYVWDNYDEERLKKYIGSLVAKEKAAKDKATESGKKKPAPKHNFLLIDDCLGLIDQSDWFKNFIFSHRHTGTSIFLAAQYLPSGSGCGTFLRACTNFSFIWPSYMENSIKSSFSAFGGLCGDYDEFKAALMQVAKTEHACMLFKKPVKGKAATKEEAYSQFVASPVKDFRLKYE